MALCLQSCVVHSLEAELGHVWCENRENQCVRELGLLFKISVGPAFILWGHWYPLFQTLVHQLVFSV